VGRIECATDDDHRVLGRLRDFAHALVELLQAHHSSVEHETAGTDVDLDLRVVLFGRSVGGRRSRTVRVQLREDILLLDRDNEEDESSNTTSIIGVMSSCGLSCGLRAIVLTLRYLALRS
jgi:hypothetical protein